ncbi:hypothetical protein ARMGADRAFT_284688 [Armillaria gallica]|uniref:Uncharacterized protein n=1 Tax=Armillaria gallica TaxID=47427 RepID=A0A2H3D6W7_ARMGA|nr:hypothetical protein ARMGADRAFT_284688 [Armillaria gallica]
MNVECWYLYLGSCCTFPSGMSTAQVHAAPRHSCTDTPIIYRIALSTNERCVYISRTSSILTEYFRHFLKIFLKKTRLDASETFYSRSSTLKCM